MKYNSYSGNKLDYGMRVYVDNAYEYIHIYADFFVVENNEKRWTHDLSGFRVSCQSDRENIQKDDPFYAIHFEFSDNVNTDNFEEVSKVLKLVDKSLKNYRDKFGYIQGIGEYLLAVCLALGVKDIYWNNQDYYTKDIKWIVSNFIRNKKEDWNYKG